MSVFQAALAGSIESGIVRSGLIQYLDAGSTISYPGSGTTWTDISGNGLDVTLSGTAFNTDKGGAIEFGTGDQGASTNNFSFSGGGFTLSCWLKHTGVLAASVERYITVNGTTEAAVLRHNSSSTTALHTYFFDTGNTFRSVDVTGQLVTNTYYYVAGTYNGTVLTLYKNAVSVGSLTITTTLQTPGAMSLSSSAESFIGNMYQVMCYNRALSVTELTQNYYADRARYGLS